MGGESGTPENLAIGIGFGINDRFGSNDGLVFEYKSNETLSGLLFVFFGSNVVNINYLRSLHDQSIHN